MNICVFGLWHLGSVTGACLAKLGHKIVGLDFDKPVVKGLQKAQAPLWETGLNELIAQQIKAGRLSFSSDPRAALRKAQVLWITFDTPVNDKDMADIRFLEKNFKKIMPYINDGTGIIVSSQAPVGFVGQIQKVFEKQYPDKKCFFACSPENLRLGKGLEAFLNPDRIIIGVGDQESKRFFSPLFQSITGQLEWMTIPSAEMTKHAINSFLALSVCFANEMAGLCEYTGADAKEVERGLKTESRIGPKAYLSPGTAFSGGTLARDVNFLIDLSDQSQLPSFLIKAVNQSNSFHKTWIERKCRELLGSFKHKTVAILGLTYKSGTDTLRRSWAVELAQSLNAQGACVIAFDPVVKSLPRHLTKIIGLKRSLKEIVPMADAFVIAVQLPELQRLDSAILNLMKTKVIIDPNGVMAKSLADKGFKYVSVAGGKK